MLSEKENFLRALGGEVPEYVPRYDIFWGVRPSILMGGRVGGVGVDMYGVEWSNKGSAFEAAMPRNDYFILDDIRRWRDVIKFPDFSHVDWEELAKKDLKDFNPEFPRGGGTAAAGFFQSVMAFMGFTEGLIACFEEPDEVKELINYLCDNYLSLADNYLKYYKPDFISFADDIAAERSPFVSLEMFRDIFAPVWRKYIKFFKDRGYLAVHHNCGHFESFLDDVVDMGFNAWDPAQESNDLVGIKKKFGNKLMICGGFETRRFLPFIDISEEEIRASLKAVLDKLAPGGGYAFFGTVMDENPIAKQRTEWLDDEFKKLRGTYYS